MPCCLPTSNHFLTNVDYSMVKYRRVNLMASSLENMGKLNISVITSRICCKITHLELPQYLAGCNELWISYIPTSRYLETASNQPSRQRNHPLLPVYGEEWSIVISTAPPHAKLVSLTSPCCSGWPAPMNTLKANNGPLDPGVGDKIIFRFKRNAWYF